MSQRRSPCGSYHEAVRIKKAERLLIRKAMDYFKVCDRAWPDWRQWRKNGHIKALLRACAALKKHAGDSRGIK